MSDLKYPNLCWDNVPFSLQQFVRWHDGRVVVCLFVEVFEEVEVADNGKEELKVEIGLINWVRYLRIVRIP